MEEWQVSRKSPWHINKADDPFLRKHPAPSFLLQSPLLQPCPEAAIEPAPKDIPFSLVISEPTGTECVCQVLLGGRNGITCLP